MTTKKIFLSLMMMFIAVCFAQAQQANDYSSNWKKVDQFEKKVLTKSALNEVLKIYDLATKDHNDVQQIKATIYQLKYRDMIGDEDKEDNFFFLDTLISKAKAPAKNILLSIQAELLWKYLQDHRWQLYDRTTVAEEKSADISTWSIDNINNTIAGLYKASLANETILKSTNISSYDAILNKGENTRQLRPTLYDLLTQRALSFFMNDERDVTEPAYSFTIDDDRFFTPANEFVNTEFITKDTSSLYFKAILLFQNILKFHLKDASPSALIDADIMRIDFVKNHAVMETKEKLYEDALMKIETNYPEDSVTAQAGYLRAKLYFDHGQYYDPPGKTADEFEIKKSKDLCEAIIKRWPKSEGGINAKNLLTQILAPSLSIETEKVNIPGQPFRSLVSYKNVDTLYLRVIKISREEIKRSDADNESYWRMLTTLRPTKEWSVTLPELQDHQTHSTEIKIDALPSGAYFILASNNAAFPISKNELSKQLIYVSNISYIYNDDNYYVLNRDNGQPLPNVKIQVWNERYNYSASKYEDTKAEQYITNGNGYFKLKKYKEDGRNVLLQFIAKDDELFLDDENELSSNTPDDNDVPKPTTFLFTDRSIYRPGQTVYFKGIVIKPNNKKNENNALPNFKTTITLLDANDQKVASQTVTTNEFGSYHGTFILPQNLLNGNFSISDSVTESNSNFNVEEYKRPNFYVEIEKPKGAYRLFDSITVTGNTKAYAGNNIDGAVVKYRVVRKVIYPMFDSYNKYLRNDKSEMEIANGEVATNAKGEFNVTFKAIPDQSIDKKEQPVFYYEVSADVTDINGETRSGSTSVAVAYQSLQLNIDVADQVLVDSFKNIMVKSTDLNDQRENSFVSLTIQELRSPEKIFRERYWKEPDKFLMSKDEYYRCFPYDIYKDENEISNFETKEIVYQRSDSSDRAWAFTNKWKSGYYKIIATTKDKYGEEVNDVKYIQLTQTNDKAYTPIEITTDKPVAQPGDKVTYTIKTGFNKIWLINSLYKMDSSRSLNYINIPSGNPFEQTINVTENDRGGIVSENIFVQHNRVYSGNQNINIAWSNKDLNISFNTFRNKLLPGEKETWSVKITGSKNEKVAAELLAAMYDASLDQFYQQSWETPDIWPTLDISNNWENDGFEETRSEKKYGFTYAMGAYPKAYDRLLNFENAIFQRGYFSNRVAIVYDKSNYKLELADSTIRATGSSISTIKFTPPKVVMDKAVAEPVYMFDATGTSMKYMAKKISQTDLSQQQQPPIQIRKNFNETAFFFPDLKTDTAGNIEFNFTMPDAVTQWKWMMLAHTKEMATAYAERTVVTQKPLMVQPNAPRFLREGDKMEFSAKIVNLSDSILTGDAQLELLDVATNQPVNSLFKNDLPSQTFSVQAGQSVAIKFPIEIPLNFNSALTYRIVAKANNFSDGEEMILPVLTNRTLVTESMPLNLRNANKKEFKFEKLLNSDNSKTLSNHALTVEFTSNPAWYAVQALPYLMEYPYECAEQTFNRYYANALASYISNSTPTIKAIFDKWKNTDTAALLSNLQKNEELKSALLQETPWVLDAQNEQQQKKNIALLFDMARMSSEQEKALDKLKDMQSSNGGFTWFKGGPDDRYITQYIVTGIGHLHKLNALNKSEKIKDILDNAIPYLDKKIKEDYDDLIRFKNIFKTNNLGYTQIQYLYMRSFFPEYKIPVASQTAYNYYRSQAQKYWMDNDKYMQAMIALALYRTNDNVTSKAIINSLKENAINKEEMGMYWKEWETGGYYWYQAPIESQALMIEAFTDIDKNISTINDLKTWLLKQKQTQNWKTTKATAEACYALLLNGSNWLAEEKNVQISIGDTVINSNQQTDEAGTGYFKKTIEGDRIKPKMGNISVSITDNTYLIAGYSKGLFVPDNQPINQSTIWGSVYWQYFEDLDKITPAETSLKLNKKLFIEKNSDKGPILIAVTDTTTLNIGDKIKVRIELKVDRDMEYIHLKDMRAGCMEPVNVLSEYKWQDGLGYYESTKDASTNFFFDQLPKGSYVFEYPLFVTHSGNFSNGITTIQCMYAPEFSAHSEGVRVTVN